MVFEVYVAGPLETSRERLQMDEVIRALNAAFGPKEELVRLIVDIGRNVQNGALRQIDGLLTTKGRLFILELKGVRCEQLTVQYDVERQELADGSGGRWRPASVQPKWLIDGAPWEEQKVNPLDQIRAQRQHLITLILDTLKGNASKKDNSEPMRPKEDDPRYQLGKAISGFIVYGSGRVVYGTEEAGHYVKSQRWLDIVPMADLINRILAETAGRPTDISLISESEFKQLVRMVGAEKRLYHRWLTKPLEHEYTEISRVPSLDFLIESEDAGKLMTAIDAAHKFRLRAYAEDVAGLYYRIPDERVKGRALTVLADWEDRRLGKLLVHALEMGDAGLLVPATALGILRQENAFPETLPNLERVMNRSYDSDRDYGFTPAVVKALGNLRSLEAGKVIHSLFLRATSGDYYSRLEEQARDDERVSARRAQFERDLLPVILENLAACRYTESAGQMRRLLVEFPVDRYVSLIRTFKSPGNESELLVNGRIQLALQNALGHLTAWVGDVWDGHGEAEILQRIEEVYHKIIREGGDIFGYSAVYRPYLKAIAQIRSPDGLSMLKRHLDSLPPVTANSKWTYHRVRGDIIEAIADTGLQEGYDFLVEKLQAYEAEPHLFDQQILSIVDSLRRTGNPRYVGAISAVLELRDSDSTTESVQGIRQSAALALAELGGRRAFEVLVQVFMKEPGLALEPIRRILYASTPSFREDLAKHAESLLLPKLRESPPLPGSYESYLLAEVASEASLDLLFELAWKPEWYSHLPPQRIGDFAHLDWVKERLFKMLESTEEHHRAFAINMISGSGCLGEGADTVLAKFATDSSPLVRNSLLDHYAYAKKDSLAVTRFFKDQDAAVRAHATEVLRHVVHQGGRRCLVVSRAEWQRTYTVVYNDKGVFFLGTSERDAETATLVESTEPFFVTGDCIADMFVWPGSVRIAGVGKVPIHGLYLEERGGKELLLLPLREDRDELNLSDRDFIPHWFDDIVLTLHGREDRSESGVQKADELMRLVDEKFLPSPR